MNQEEFDEALENLMDVAEDFNRYDDDSVRDLVQASLTLAKTTDMFKKKKVYVEVEREPKLLEMWQHTGPRED